VQLRPAAVVAGADVGVTGERRAPLSLLVVNAQSSLAPLQRALEGRIRKRVAAGKVGIGPGGELSYEAERGALALSTSANLLVVEAPIEARVEACRGANCYASCQPRALVRAEVPLLLGADYRFQPARVTLRFTRGCKVRALGGLLTLDVTPTLEAQLAPELGKVASEIDRQLPDVRAQVEVAWRELSTERELPLGGCLVLAPSGVIQGPVEPSASLLLARFAIQLTPELRTRCGEATAERRALPPLQSDASLSEEGLIRLGMVTPLTSLERAFDSAATALGGKSARIAGAKVAPRGADVDVELLLRGEVCGAVALTAQPDFSGDGRHIGLTKPQVSAAERDRWLEASLEPASGLEALIGLARVSPLLSVQGFREAVPALASAQSTPRLELGAHVSSARPAGAAARGEELVAWLEARGSVSLKLQ
jgi:Domain of unknown function (DUF4403)